MVIYDWLLSLSRMPSRAVCLRTESHSMQVWPAELPAVGGHGRCPLRSMALEVWRVSPSPSKSLNTRERCATSSDSPHCRGLDVPVPQRARHPRNFQRGRGSGVGVGGAHFSEAGPGRGLPGPVPVPLCFPKCYTQLSASEVLVCPGLVAVLVGAVPHLWREEGGGGSR